MDDTALHIECRFNKNSLLRRYFLVFLPAGSVNVLISQARFALSTSGFVFLCKKHKQSVAAPTCIQFINPLSARAFFWSFLKKISKNLTFNAIPQEWIKISSSYTKMSKSFHNFDCVRVSVSTMVSCRIFPSLALKGLISIILPIFSRLFKYICDQDESIGFFMRDAINSYLDGQRYYCFPIGKIIR